jgi:hypothetical protein
LQTSAFTSHLLEGMDHNYNVRMSQQFRSSQQQQQQQSQLRNKKKEEDPDLFMRLVRLDQH